MANMMYIICYDISDDRHRTKLAKFLEGWGRRIERSVFECRLSRKQAEEMKNKIQEFVDGEEDYCHIFKICAECKEMMVTIGKEYEDRFAEVIVV